MIFLKLLLCINFLILGDNADEDTTNAGKESEQQKNDLKKIHDNVDDDTKGQLISKGLFDLFKSSKK